MKAGDLYSEVTGNIWSYARRGDVTGVKAALARGVDCNTVNIAGWSPCHAAASGGQVHILRLLIRHGADLSLRDRAGNQAVHQAALGGHVACLDELAKAGADLTAVRLSGCNGKAAREVVAAATRKKASQGGASDEGGPVGYARVQAKSNAFFGPRRQPISCKIRREILKRKRRERHESRQVRDAGAVDAADGDAQAEGDVQGDPRASALGLERGYQDTVRAIKQTTKLSRGARRAKAREAVDASDAALASAAAALALDAPPEGDDDDDDDDDSAAAPRSASAFALLADSDEEDSS